MCEESKTEQAFQRCLREQEEERRRELAPRMSTKPDINWADAPAEDEAMSEYNEPWIIDDYGVLRDCERDQITFGKRLERARDCVNAMQGKDPAKLKALVQAINRVMALFDPKDGLGFNCHIQNIRELQAALVAFEQKGAENEHQT